ncbi:MAG: ribosome biogenesis GTP-binding protein YihA/YsxC [Deferribacterota bacterium]|nr:ribosome biogenesis GTP-binding protein YihA/YsxC [Deferribacterota bacterium]
MSTYLICSAYKVEQLPKTNLPNIVLTGRSNVGKSTLINKLIGRKQLARTSNKPGKTISINFYNYKDMIIFVDLPGYGFAHRSKSTVLTWKNLVETFFNKNDNLELFLLLIDVRIGVKDKDLELFYYLEQFNKDIIPILTKTDKVNKNYVNKQIDQTSAIINLSPNKIKHFSHKDPKSMVEIWNTINKALQRD